MTVPERYYYPKIPTMWQRDPATHTVMPDCPVHESVASAINLGYWSVSVKVDGISRAAMWTGTGWDVYGRTPNTNMLPWETDVITDTLAHPDFDGFLKRARPPKSDDPPGEDVNTFSLRPGTILFGELIGPRVNGNRHCLDEHQWLIYDLMLPQGLSIAGRDMGRVWLRRNYLITRLPQNRMVPTAVVRSLYWVDSPHHLDQLLRISVDPDQVIKNPEGIVAVADGWKGHALDRTFVKLKFRDFN